MLISELLAYKRVEVFFKKVFRETPLNYYYKLEIREELCDHLLLAIADGESGGMSRTDAVNAAVEAMGRPSAVGKIYRESYKGFPRYAQYSFLYFSQRWLGVIWYYITVFIVGFPAAGGALWFAIPAVAISAAWGILLSKWQYVLINVLAPLPLAIIAAVTSGQGEIVKNILTSPFLLCWTLPAALSYALCYCEICLERRPRLIAQGCMAALIVLFCVLQTYLGASFGKIAANELNYNLTMVSSSLSSWDGTNGDALLTAVEAFDNARNGYREHAVIVRDATIAESSSIYALLAEIPEITGGEYENEDVAESRLTLIQETINDMAALCGSFTLTKEGLSLLSGVSADEVLTIHARLYDAADRLRQSLSELEDDLGQEAWWYSDYEYTDIWVGDEAKG